MKTTSNGVWYHEDEVCQIELLPISNWSHCETEVKAIAEFSNAHKAAIGWTDVYLRKENPQPIANLGLKADEIRGPIGRFLPQISPVKYLWGHELKKCRGGILANGTDQNCVVFFDISSEEVVTNIWLRLDVTTSDQIAAVSSAFLALAEKWEFLLVDWGWCWLLKLGDASSIRDYLEKRKEVFGEAKGSVSQ